MKTASVLAITAMLATPAFAGSMAPAPTEPTVAPAPVAPAPSRPTWTGGYAGVQLGYGKLDADSDGGDGDPDTLFGLDNDGDGVIGGVHAGYDHDFGNFVLGGELDYDFGDIDVSDADGSTSLDSITRLKLRGGYDLGRTLVYGVAGPANAKLDGDSETGFVYGVGAQYLLTEKVSLGGEILQHKFDDFDNSDVDIDATTATARVSYRF